MSKMTMPPDAVVPFASTYISQRFGTGENNRQPLIQAVYQRDLLSVFVLLRLVPILQQNPPSPRQELVPARPIVEKQDVNGTVNRFGDTALHLAARRGRTDVVELLLRESATVNATNQYGWTPLMIAVTKGHLAAVKCLLSHGANVQVSSELKDTALHIAVKNGNLKMAKCLLSHGADPNIYAYCHDPCYKLTSFEKRKTDIIYKVGADIARHYSSIGETPLQIAVIQNNTEMVNLLLEYRANVDLPAECRHYRFYGERKFYGERFYGERRNPLSNQTIVELACKTGGMQAAHLLLGKGGYCPNENDLCAAILSYDIENVKLILERGIDINCKLCGLIPYERWATPLTLPLFHLSPYASPAESEGHWQEAGEKWEAMVRFLLENGADVDTPCAIHWAAEFGLLKMVELLVEHGADINSPFRSWTPLQSWTPLHFASRSLHLGVVRFLLARGAKASMRCSNGKKPFEVIGSAYDQQRPNEIANLLRIRNEIANLLRAHDDEEI